MDPPFQSSRDACHTTTPTTGSIAHIDTKGRWTPQERQLVADAFWERILWDVLGSHLGNKSQNLQQSVFQGFKSDKQFAAECVPRI